tara:strand:+ start:6501 stop:7610 length:1110 start_codon:yes stop_codon:yes gene_type:complete
MAGYIGARSVTLSTTVANAQDVTATDTTPEVTIINNTHEDSDSGREGKVIFKGQQSGGEESTLAEIEANHHGSSDDEAGQLVFRTNDGSDGAVPTERMRIDSSGKMTVTATDQSVAVMQHSSSSTAALNGGAIFNIKNTDTTNGNQSSIIFRDSGDNSTSGIFGFNTDHSDGEGFMKFGTRNSSGTFGERMRIDSSGNVLVGTTSSFGTSGITLGANNVLYSAAAGQNVANFQRYTSDGELVRFGREGTTVGSITVSSSATAFNTSSDYRLKENVTNVTDGITRVKQLSPKRFNFIADADTTVDGFLAHEAQTVVPEAITGTKDEVDDNGDAVMQQIDQAKLVPLLTAALQEAIAKIETLETKVAALEG